MANQLMDNHDSHLLSLPKYKPDHFAKGKVVKLLSFKDCQVYGRSQLCNTKHEGGTYPSPKFGETSVRFGLRQEEIKFNESAKGIKAPKRHQRAYRF